MTTSVSLTVTKVPEKNLTVSLRGGSALITEFINTSSDLNLTEPYEKCLILTTIDGFNFSFQRFVFPILPNSIISEVIPNGNLSKVAVVGTDKTGQNRVFIYNLSSSIPWSAENAICLTEEATYVSWVSMNALAIISSSNIIHWTINQKNILVKAEEGEKGVKFIAQLNNGYDFEKVLSYQVASTVKYAVLEVLNKNHQKIVILIDVSSGETTVLENIFGVTLVMAQEQVDLIAIAENNSKPQLVIIKMDSEKKVNDYKNISDLKGNDISDIFPDGLGTQTMVKISGTAKKLYVISQRYGYAAFYLNSTENNGFDQFFHEDKKITSIEVHPITGKVMAIADSRDKLELVFSDLNPSLLEPSDPLDPGCIDERLRGEWRHIPLIAYDDSTPTATAAAEAIFSHENLSKHIQLNNKPIGTSYFCRELFMNFNGCRMLASQTLLKLADTVVAVQLHSDEKLRHHIPRAAQIVLTPNTERNVRQILSAYTYNNPMLIEGETAGGKTATVEYCAAQTNSPLLRLNLTPETSIQDFIGSLGFSESDAFSAQRTPVGRDCQRRRPLLQRQTTMSEKIKLEFKPGPFTRAVKDGYWLLLDEANLASDEILRMIEDVLGTGILLIRNSNILGQPGVQDGCLQVRRHPNFRLFMAQNPANDKAYAGTRNVFSVSLLSHFVPVNFPAIPIYPDILGIITIMLTKRYTDQSEASNVANRLISLFDEAKQIPRENSVPISIRDVLQACKLIIKIDSQNRQISLPNALHLLFAQHMTEGNILRVKELVEKLFGPVEIKEIPKDTLLQQTSTATLDSYGKLFEFFDMCYATKRPGLLSCGQFSGKATSILSWAKCRGIPTEVCYVTFETTTEDLFGRILPDNNSAAPFKWIDGPVTKAMKNGKCLVLCGINQPEDAVLESLNAVLESGSEDRQLHIANKFIQVDPNFFVFATYSKASSNDPIALTPALLSRFLCVSISEDITDQEAWRLVCSYINGAELQRPLHENLTKAKKDCKRTVSLGEVCTLLRVAQELLPLSKSPAAFLEHIKSLSQMLLSNELSSVDSGEHCNMPFTVEKEWFMNRGYILSPSRQFLATVISISIYLDVPLLLQGPAGVGKTSLVKLVGENIRGEGSTIVFSCNKETTVNDLMGNFVPSQQTSEFKEGPLCKAISKGYIFVADELNLAPTEVVAFLTPFLTYPKEFLNPINGEITYTHDKFTFIATQNPPEYAGRNLLPKSVESRFLKVKVPDYSRQEIVNILRIRVKTYEKNCNTKITPLNDLPARMEYLTDLIRDTSQKRKLTLTLRHFLKLLRRLVILGDLYHDKWQLLMQLHVTCLFSLSNDGLIGNVEKKGNSWLFRLTHPDFPDACISSTWTCKQNGELPYPMLPGEVLLLCKLALALCCKEPVVIDGPTGYKTEAIFHFSQLASISPLDQKQALLNIMYLSNLTATSDLFGEVEPHSPTSFVSSYAFHIAQLIYHQISPEIGPIKPLQSTTVDEAMQFYRDLWERLRQRLISTVQTFDEVVAKQMSVDDDLFLENYPKKKFEDDNLAANALLILEILTALEKKMSSGQGFPFCERGLMPTLRFGGIALLKNINMPDQAIMESLNTITELEAEVNHPHNVDLPLVINSDFHIVATIHQPAFRAVSPALRSRYTFINVEATEIQSVEVCKFIENYLSCKLFIEQEFSKEIATYLFDFLKLFKKCFPAAYRQINIADLIKWTNFAKVKVCCPIECKMALQFVWATQFVFLDKMDSLLLPALLKEMQSLKFERLSIENGFDVHTREPKIEEPVFCTNGETGETFLKGSGLVVTGAPSILIEELVLTPKTIFNITRLLLSHYTGNAVCLVGPPGVGKSKLSEVFAKMAGMGFLRISCSGNMTADDLFGSFTPCVEKNLMIFRFEEGVLVKAMKMPHGCVVLLDEINLASSEILSTLTGILKHPKDKLYEVQGQKYDHSQVQFICAMNPPGVGGGRQDLPTSLTGLLSTVMLDCMSDEEITKIITVKYGPTFGPLENLQRIIKVHFSLIADIALQNGFIKPCNVSFNLRDIQKLAAIYHGFGSELQEKDIFHQNMIFALLAVIIYAERFPDSKNRLLAQRYILELYQVPESGLMERESLLRQSGNSFAVISSVKANDIEFVNINHSRGLSLHSDGRLTHSLEYSRKLEMLYLAIRSKRMVNVCGPSVSGKTSAVMELARLQNKKLLLLAINVDTEISDLIGGFAPVDPAQPKFELQQELTQCATQLLKHIPFDQVPQFVDYICSDQRDSLANLLKSTGTYSDAQIHFVQLQNLLKQLDSQQKESTFSTGFRFFSGPVIEAMVGGHWLLLDNVDLAKPQVIERLNSLGEDNCCLHSMEIGSRGGVKKYEPTLGFACICTSNVERKGSHPLSEAFKNRCIEFYFEPVDMWGSESIIGTLNQVDTHHPMCNSNVVHTSYSVLEEHKQLIKNRSSDVAGYNITFRNANRMLENAHYITNRHQTLKSAYGTALSNKTQEQSVWPMTAKNEVAGDGLYVPGEGICGLASSAMSGLLLQSKAQGASLLEYIRSLVNQADAIKASVYKGMIDLLTEILDVSSISLVENDVTTIENLVKIVVSHGLPAPAVFRNIGFVMLFCLEEITVNTKELLVTITGNLDFDNSLILNWTLSVVSIAQAPCATIEVRKVTPSDRVNLSTALSVLGPWQQLWPLKSQQLRTLSFSTFHIKAEMKANEQNLVITLSDSDAIKILPGANCLLAHNIALKVTLPNTGFEFSGDVELFPGLMVPFHFNQTSSGKSSQSLIQEVSLKKAFNAILRMSDVDIIPESVRAAKVVLTAAGDEEGFSSLEIELGTSDSFWPDLLNFSFLKLSDISGRVVLNKMDSPYATLSATLVIQNFDQKIRMQARIPSEDKSIKWELTEPVKTTLFGNLLQCLTPYTTLTGTGVMEQLEAGMSLNRSSLLKIHWREGSINLLPFIELTEVQLSAELDPQLNIKLAMSGSFLIFKELQVEFSTDQMNENQISFSISKSKFKSTIKKLLSLLFSQEDVENFQSIAWFSHQLNFEFSAPKCIVSSAGYNTDIRLSTKNWIIQPDVLEINKIELSILHSTSVTNFSLRGSCKFFGMQFPCMVLRIPSQSGIKLELDNTDSKILMSLKSMVCKLLNVSSIPEFMETESLKASVQEFQVLLKEKSVNCATLFDKFNLDLGLFHLQFERTTLRVQGNYSKKNLQISLSGELSIGSIDSINYTATFAKNEEGLCIMFTSSCKKNVIAMILALLTGGYLKLNDAGQSELILKVTSENNVSLDVRCNDMKCNFLNFFSITHAKMLLDMPKGQQQKVTLGGTFTLLEKISLTFCTKDISTEKVSFETESGTGEASLVSFMTALFEEMSHCWNELKKIDWFFKQQNFTVAIKDFTIYAPHADVEALLVMELSDWVVFEELLTLKRVQISLQKEREKKWTLTLSSECELFGLCLPEIGMKFPEDKIRIRNLTTNQLVNKSVADFCSQALKVSTPNHLKSLSFCAVELLEALPLEKYFKISLVLQPWKPFEPPINLNFRDIRLLFEWSQTKVALEISGAIEVFNLTPLKFSGTISKEQNEVVFKAHAEAENINIVEVFNSIVKAIGIPSDLTEVPVLGNVLITKLKFDLEIRSKLKSFTLIWHVDKVKIPFTDVIHMEAVKFCFMYKRDSSVSKSNAWEGSCVEGALVVADAYLPQFSIPLTSKNKHWTLTIPESLTLDNIQSCKASLERSLNLSSMISRSFHVPLPDIGLNIDSIKFLSKWKSFAKPELVVFEMGMQKIVIFSQPVEFTLHDTLLHLTYDSKKKASQPVDVLKSALQESDCYLQFSVVLGKETQKKLRINSCKMSLPFQKDQHWSLNIPKQQINFGLGDMISLWTSFDNIGSELDDIGLPIDIIFKEIYLQLDWSNQKSIKRLEFETMATIKPEIKIENLFEFCGVILQTMKLECGSYQTKIFCGVKILNSTFVMTVDKKTKSFQLTDANNSCCKLLSNANASLKLSELYNHFHVKENTLEKMSNLFENAGTIKVNDSTKLQISKVNKEVLVRSEIFGIKLCVIVKKTVKLNIFFGAYYKEEIEWGRIWSGLEILNDIPCVPRFSQIKVFAAASSDQMLTRRYLISIGTEIGTIILPNNFEKSTLRPPMLVLGATVTLPDKFPYSILGLVDKQFSATVVIDKQQAQLNIPIESLKIEALSLNYCSVELYKVQDKWKFQLAFEITIPLPTDLECTELKLHEAIFRGALTVIPQDKVLEGKIKLQGKDGQPAWPSPFGLHFITLNSLALGVMVAQGSPTVDIAASGELFGVGVELRVIIGPEILPVGGYMKVENWSFSQLFKFLFKTNLPAWVDFLLPKLHVMYLLILLPETAMLDLEWPSVDVTKLGSDVDDDKRIIQRMDEIGPCFKFYIDSEWLKVRATCWGGFSVENKKFELGMCLKEKLNILGLLILSDKKGTGPPYAYIGFELSRGLDSLVIKMSCRLKFCQIIETSTEVWLEDKQLSIEVNMELFNIVFGFKFRIGPKTLYASALVENLRGGGLSNMVDSIKNACNKLLKTLEEKMDKTLSELEKKKKDSSGIAWLFWTICSWVVNAAQAVIHCLRKGIDFIANCISKIVENLCTIHKFLLEGGTKEKGGIDMRAEIDMTIAGYRFNTRHSFKLSSDSDKKSANDAGYKRIAQEYTKECAKDHGGDRDPGGEQEGDSDKVKQMLGKLRKIKSEMHQAAKDGRAPTSDSAEGTSGPHEQDNAEPPPEQDNAEQDNAEQDNLEPPPEQDKPEPPPEQNKSEPPPEQDNLEPPPEQNKPIPLPEEDKPEPPEQEQAEPPPEQEKPEPPPEQDKPVPPEQGQAEPPPEEDKPVPPPEQDNLEPPPEQDKPVPPEQEQAEPPPEEDKLKPPPEQDNLEPPPEQDKPVPPEQEQAEPPPEQEKPEPPPEQDKPVPPEQEQAEPPEQEQAEPPPEQEKPEPPPEQDKPVPPEQEQAEPPPEEDKLKPPPEQENLEPPPEQDKPVPPEQEQAEPPPEEDKPVPPPEQDNLVPPPEQDKPVPPEQERAEPPPEEDKLEPPPEQDNAEPPPEEDKPEPPEQEQAEPPPEQEQAEPPPEKDDADEEILTKSPETTTGNKFDIQGIPIPPPLLVVFPDAKDENHSEGIEDDEINSDEEESEISNDQKGMYKDDIGCAAGNVHGEVPSKQEGEKNDSDAESSDSKLGVSREEEKVDNSKDDLNEDDFKNSDQQKSERSTIENQNIPVQILEDYLNASESLLPTISNVLNVCQEPNHGVVGLSSGMYTNRATILIDYEVIGEEYAPNVVFLICETLNSLSYTFQIIFSGDRLVSEPMVLKPPRSMWSAKTAQALFQCLRDATLQTVWFAETDHCIKFGETEVQQGLKNSDVVILVTKRMLKFTDLIKQEYSSNGIIKIGCVSFEDNEVSWSHFLLDHADERNACDGYQSWIKLLLSETKANFQGTAGETAINPNSATLDSSSLNKLKEWCTEPKISTQNLYIYGNSDINFDEDIQNSLDIDTLRPEKLDTIQPVGHVHEAAELFDVVVSKWQHIEHSIRTLFSSIPANLWTRYSTSSKGKILSIKGLMNWFITKGTSTDIWLTKNRGGQHQMSICLVLALSPQMQRSLPELSLALLIIVNAFEKLKLSTSCIAFSDKVTMVKDTNGPVWDENSKARLVQALTEPFLSSELGGTNHYLAADMKAMNAALHLLLNDGNVRPQSPCYMLVFTDHGPGYRLRSDIRTFAHMAEKTGVNCWALGVGRCAAATVQHYGIPRFIACENPLNIDQAVHEIFTRQPTSLEISPIHSAITTDYRTKLGFDTSRDFPYVMDSKAAARVPQEAPPETYLSCFLDYYKKAKSEKSTRQISTNQINVDWLNGEYLDTVFDEGVQEKVIRLKYVWWLNIETTIPNVTPGRYNAVWKLKFDRVEVPQNLNFHVEPMPEDCGRIISNLQLSHHDCKELEAKNNRDWFELVIGQVEMHKEGSIRISLKAHENQTKKNIFFHTLKLAPVDE